MLRLPAHVHIGPYTLHLDVLAARIHRRQRRVQQVAWVVVALLILSVGAIFVFPFVRGTGVILLPERNALVNVAVDGHAFIGNSMHTSPGHYIVRFERGGTFPVEQPIEVTSNQTTTLALPTLRPIPEVQRLPLPYVQSSWTQVEPDVSGGWRIGATQQVAEDAHVRPGWGATRDMVAPRTLLHLDANGLTPLSLLETYTAADELVTEQGERFWAVWEPQKIASRPGIVGMLSLTTPKGTETLSTSVVLDGVWWSPGGRMLLVAVRREQHLDLALLDPKDPQVERFEPVVSVAGIIQNVNWQPDGRGVVVTSIAQNGAGQAQLPSRPTPTPPIVASDAVAIPRSAVLLRIPSNGTKPQAVRLHSPPPYPVGIVPLYWFADHLWWIADTGLGLVLEHISLSDGAVQRTGELPQGVAAFTVLPDGTVRILREIQDKQLVVERWPESIALFTIPNLVAQDVVGGIWQDTDLILATSDTELWCVRIQPEALQ